MAEYTRRYFSTGFWEDNYVGDELKTPEAKLLFNYLITSPQTSSCGIYEFRLGKAAFDTAIPIEQVEELIKKFVEDGRIKYSSSTKEIFIPRWTRHNWYNRANHIESVKKGLRKVKSAEFLDEWFEMVARWKINPGFSKDDLGYGDALPKAEEPKKRGRKPGYRKPVTFEVESIAYQLATYLLKKIRENHEEFSDPDLQEWSRVIDDMLKTGKTYGDIASAISWSHDDKFWRAHIISADALKSKYDTLRIQQKAEQKKNAKPK